MPRSTPIDEYMRRTHLIMSTQEQCVEIIDRYIKLGVTYFMLTLPFAYEPVEALETLRFFAENVIPTIKGG